jgi:hypothetical protein
MRKLLLVLNQVSGIAGCLFEAAGIIKGGLAHCDANCALHCTLDTLTCCYKPQQGVLAVSWR